MQTARDQMLMYRRYRIQELHSIQGEYKLLTFVSRRRGLGGSLGAHIRIKRLPLRHFDEIVPYLEHGYG